MHNQKEGRAWRVKKDKGRKITSRISRIRGGMKKRNRRGRTRRRRRSRKKKINVIILRLLLFSGK
jgi:hypothetical protein